MDVREHYQFLDNFEKHYKYDGSYLRDLLEYTPEGFNKFSAFMPMSTHKEKLAGEDFWVAKLAAMQAEDCGSCLQLNIRMALEAGVDKEIVKSVLEGGISLSEKLQTVYKFARSVAENEPLDSATQEKVDTQLSKAERMELGLCVASARVFPTLKRAAGRSQSCSIMEFEV